MPKVSLYTTVCVSVICLSVGAIGGGEFRNHVLYNQLAELQLCPCSEVDMERPPPPQSGRDSIVASEARRWGIPVRLALAVTRVENWSGDSTAVSSAGAVGIMQVMPFWKPLLGNNCIERTGPPWSWPIEEQRSLVDMQLNACIGVQVLRDYYLRHGNWNDALRAYNGALTSRKGDVYVSQVVERLHFGTALEGAI